MQTKKLQGDCHHCGQLIEFEAEAVGTTANCPHCGQPTELMLALPPDNDSTLRTKAVVFGAILVVILLVGVVGTMLAFKRAQRLSAQNQESPTKAIDVQTPRKPADPFSSLGFRLSPIRLDQAEGSSIVHAVGTIANLSNHQRFGVRVELDLLDANSNRVGSATDYRATLEANEEWRFRALVVEKRAVSARIAAIKEDK